MLNFPFYNKHSNYLILDKNLRDYIKKTNTVSFNKFTEQQEQQQYKNTKTNSNNSLLSASLMNYRNYSDTFINNQIDVSELENEDYLCNFCDLSDCQHIFSSNNTNTTNTTNNRNTANTTNIPNSTNSTNITNTTNKIIIKKIYFLIGGTSAFIGIATGITVLYYKYF
jgi:hypothetical protein